MGCGCGLSGTRKKSARSPVGIERTLLCATRFWSADSSSRGYPKGKTTPTLLRGVRHVVREQGFKGPEVTAAIRRLERDGFVKLGGQGTGKTIALTDSGGRVGCSTVRLSPWTDEGYPGAALRGMKKR